MKNLSDFLKEIWKKTENEELRFGHLRLMVKASGEKHFYKTPYRHQKIFFARVVDFCKRLPKETKRANRY